MLSLQQRERRQAWVLLAPMIIVMFLLTAWPLARTLWLSFTDTALVGNGDATNYLWLDNYGLGSGGGSRLASRTALVYSDRLLMVTSGRPYLKRIISPCSVTRRPPFRLPGG